MNTRLEYIDRLKGLAMLLVLVGHVIVFCGLGYDNVFIKHITLMNMPLFFFLNGLVVRNLSGDNKLKYLWKKFLQLMLPFLCWGGILVLYKDKTYLGFLQDYWKFGYWYLLVLFEFFVIYIIHVTLNEVINKKQVWWIDGLIFFCLCGACSFIVHFIPDNINTWIDYWQFIDYLPYFYLGGFIKRFKLSDKLLQKSSSVMTILLFCLPALYMLWQNNQFMTIVRIALPTVIILLLYLTFMLIEKLEIKDSVVNGTYVGKMLSLIGRHTLSIYMIQFFLFRYIKLNGIFETMYQEGNYIAIFAIAFVVAVVLATICIAVENIINKSTLFDFLLFGRINK